MNSSTLMGVPLRSAANEHYWVGGDATSPVHEVPVEALSIVRLTKSTKVQRE
jgi:hypothetical protein